MSSVQNLVTCTHTDPTRQPELHFHRSLSCFPSPPPPTSHTHTHTHTKISLSLSLTRSHGKAPSSPPPLKLLHLAGASLEAHRSNTNSCTTSSLERSFPKLFPQHHPLLQASSKKDELKVHQESLHHLAGLAGAPLVDVSPFPLIP